MADPKTTGALPSGEEFSPEGQAEIDRIIAGVKADTADRRIAYTIMDERAAFEAWANARGKDKSRGSSWGGAAGETTRRAPCRLHGRRGDARADIAIANG